MSNDLDLSRYEGHTPGPWEWRNNLPSNATKEDLATKALMADAPLLLAEVKRLRAEIQDIAMVNSMATAHTEQSVDAKAFLERKADQHFRQSGQFIGGNGTPVGCADFDGAVKAWALIRMRDALMEGNTLPGALLVALRESRNVIMKHNAQRPDELSWQRWDGMCEATLWDAYRAIKRAMNFPPNTEGRPTAGEAAQ
jgi:hypothetical protein